MTLENILLHIARGFGVTFGEVCMFLSILIGLVMILILDIAIWALQ